MTSGEQIKTVAVLGPGAVGGFLAALMARSGVRVICVGQEKDLAAIGQGLKVESRLFGHWQAKVEAVLKLEVKPDVLFITTKASSLPEAADRVEPKTVEGALIVPLLNGWEHLSWLQQRYPGALVAAGSISLEVFRSEDGLIKHTTPFAKINLASDEKEAAPRLKTLAVYLAALGVETKIGGSEADVLWNKLVRLNALALSTAAAQQPIGELRADKSWQIKIKACIQEAAVVAKSLGVEINPEDVWQGINALAPHQMSSLARDVAAKRQSELSAIAGAIVRAGERAGINCPVIKELIERIEKSYA